MADGIRPSTNKKRSQHLKRGLQQNEFSNLTECLSKALGAFYNDLIRYENKITIMVMSEFGRRLKANKSNGTDHGHGNVMLVLGGNVNGGKMYGQWPGLQNEQLD